MISPSRLPPGATERPGGLREYVSASRVNLWLKCLLAFKLKYVDGVPLLPTPNMFIGKRTHAALEIWYSCRQLGIPITAEQVLADLDATWDEHVAADGVAFADTREEQVCRQQTAALVGAYLAHIPPDEPRPRAVEAWHRAALVDPKTGENLGIPLVGVLDLVLPERAGPRIVDFKTAARGGALVELTHEIQLSMYSYLFRHTTHETEAVLEIRSLIKTKTAKVETHRYAARQENHFARLFAVIRAYLDDLDRGRFVFRPGLTCGSCEFADTHCRAWCG